MVNDKSVPSAINPVTPSNARDLGFAGAKRTLTNVAGGFPSNPC